MKIAAFILNVLDFMRVDLGDVGDEVAKGLASYYEETVGGINAYMLDLINVQMLKYGGVWANHFVSTANQLGAIFAICVAAYMAYKMMTKGEGIDVLQLMRPIGIAIVLAWWPTVCNVLIVPGKYVETFMRQQYLINMDEVKSLQDKREKMAYDLVDIVTGKVGEAQVGIENVKKGGGILAKIENVATELWNEVKHFFMNIVIGFMYIVEWVVCFIGEMVFSVCVYIVFLTKVLYITVLWMFGPIWIVCSILDIWKDSWSQWISKLVTASMIGAMAYLVMTFSLYLIRFTLDADIDKLIAIKNNPSIGMGAYLLNGFGTTIMTVVAYFVGAVGMSTVPELASMTFPGGSSFFGAGSFIGGMKNHAIKRTNTGAVFG